MGLIDNLMQMQEKINKLSPTIKRIEVTNWLYHKINQEASINELMYGKPKFEPYGLGSVPLWIASEDEQNDWTEEEKKKQFKVIYAIKY